MKFNYQIIIEYIGSSFVGWQIQKNGVSVQSAIEKALSKTLKSKIKIIGSGRTDTGVNALGQSANFFHKKKIDNFYKFLKSINFFLKNKQISIIHIKKRSLKFHARHCAKKRQYEYVILNRLAKPSIDIDRVWFVTKKLDITNMKKAITYFVGTHNFTAFRSSSCSAKSPIRTIDYARIRKKNNKIFIIFQSKSFLQKQVRSMVGCLKYVGEKRWNASQIKKVIKLKKRAYCAPPAPPQGLFLKKVIY